MNSESVAALQTRSRLPEVRRVPVSVFPRVSVSFWPNACAQWCQVSVSMSSSGVARPAVRDA